MGKITQGILYQRIVYYPLTGFFARRLPDGTIGPIITSKSEKGYIRFRVKGRKYFGHVLAFLYMEGRFPTDQVDHINRIKTDNRWKNLREATNSQNQHNQGLYKNSSSAVHGIYYRRGRWKARIVYNKKHIHLGSFITKREAVIARFKAEQLYFGNDINPNSSARQYLEQQPKGTL